MVRKIKENFQTNASDKHGEKLHKWHASVEANVT